MSTFTIIFKDKIQIHSFSELEKYSRVWDKIIHSFLSITGCELDEAKIIAYNSESYSYTIEVPLVFVICIETAIIDVLDTYKKLVEIRKLKYEIRSLNLSENLLDQLELEVRGIIDTTTAATIERLMDAANVNYIDANDVFTNCQTSSKLLLSFIEKGGLIEFAITDNEVANNQADRIKLLFNTIRELEKIIENK